MCDNLQRDYGPGIKVEGDPNKYLPIPKKNLIQRASCGINIGLAPDQAGYLIWTEHIIGNKRFHISQDITFNEHFDEHFDTATPTTITLFEGALPTVLKNMDIETMTHIQKIMTLMKNTQ